MDTAYMIGFVIWTQIYLKGKSDPEIVFLPDQAGWFLNQSSSSPTPFRTHFVFVA